MNLRSPLQVRKKVQRETKNTKELNIIEACPICKNKLTMPEAFKCLHFCCKTCIDDMEPITEGTETGYHCPLCRKFTAREHLQPMHFVDGLLDIVKSGKSGAISCVKCHDDAVWRCSDCKENYCTTCREQHDGFSMLRNHEWEKLSEDRGSILDKHVPCSQHPRKVIEYHCKDCQQLICMTCNNTEHKQHSAESIEDALEHIKPLVEENKQHLRQIIKSTEQALTDSRYRRKELKKEYDDLEDELDTECKRVKQKLDQDYDNIRQNLAEIRNKQLADAAEHIQDLETVLQSQNSISELSDTTLSIAKGTSLLHAIQTGLGEGLRTYVGSYIQPITYADGISAKFTPTSPSNSNIIGSVVEMPTGKHSMQIPRPLTDIAQFTATLDKKIDTTFKSIRFAKIGDQLWFLGNDTNQVHISTLEGNPTMSLQFPEITKVHGLAQVSSRVVLAADNGLFMAVNGTKLGGNKLEKLLDGQFCDATVKGNTIFALDNGVGKIHILNQHALACSYAINNSFDIAGYQKSTINTVQVTSGRLYIGHYPANTILQYSHRGDDLVTHGSPGKEVGQLQGPLLCGADSDGVLLVGEYANSRFQSLSVDGNFHTIALEGLAPNPWRAVTSDNKMYVQSSANMNVLQIFSLV